MLRLKVLKMQGIGRFVNEQVIYFDSLGKIVQVDGDNGTGGSMGSGKSTVFNALDYNLGLNKLPSTVLQSRLTKSPISTTTIYDYDGVDLTIVRGKKGLSVTIGDKIIEGNNELAEAEILNIFGMEAEIFRKTMHKRQKEGGFFLNFTPKQMYSFLIDCLGLHKQRNDLIVVEKRIESLDVEIKRYLTDITTDESALKATRDAILALGLAPIKDIHQQVILDLNAKATASAAKLTELMNDQKQQNALLDSQRPVLLPTPTLEIAQQLPQPELESTVLDNAAAIDLAVNEISLLKTEINESIKAEEQRVALVSATIQDRKLKKSVLSHTCTLAVTAQSEAVKKAGEVKKIRDAICPTCEQSWITETAKVKEAEILAALAAYKKQIVEGQQAEQEITRLTAEIADLELQKAPVENPDLKVKNERIAALNLVIAEEKARAAAHKEAAFARNSEKQAKYLTEQKVLTDAVAARNAALLAEVNTKNKQASDEYAFKVTAVRETQSRELTQVQGQVGVDRLAYEAALAKLKTYEDARVRYENSSKIMKDKEFELASRITSNENTMKLKQKELDKANELKKSIKIFLSISFEEALEFISEESTKIIRCVSRLSNATIQFDSQKETQEGKIKEEVNAVINMDGELDIPVASLSGGERSCVDIAIDLAVIDFIESRSGKGIDLFILDEPFNGLDTQSIEMLLELIKNASINKRLIIVEHNPEVKQMVSDRLVVVRTGTDSIITQPEAS